MSDPQSDDPATERELDAAVAEAERRAHAEEDADPDERVAVQHGSGDITEEPAQ